MNNLYIDGWGHFGYFQKLIDHHEYTISLIIIGHDVRANRFYPYVETFTELGRYLNNMQTSTYDIMEIDK